jgi:hypothetical protein
MRIGARTVVDVILVSVFLAPLCSAAVASGSDPFAINLAKQFVAITTGNVPVSSYVETATITRWLGTVYTSAPGSLQGAGYFDARLDMNFTNGVTSESRGVTSGGLPVGIWSDDAGVHSVTFLNATVGTHWYFPLLSSLARFADSTLTFNYVGEESWNGANALHVRVTSIAKPATQYTPASTSSTDYYIDPQTYLLVGMASRLHPDDGSPSDVSWEVHYSLYQQMAGVTVPAHIDEFLSGTRVLSVDVVNLEINPTIPATTFPVQ